MKPSIQPRVALQLPAWATSFLRRQPAVFPTPRERMRLAIALSRLSLEHGGGPFGAAVFEGRSGRLVAGGVNLVLPARCSLWHAEMVALALAQQALGAYTLRGGYELASSTEPCAMCLGAVPWSGVRRLLCGARGADAERIGFDEGAKPRRWWEALRARGIRVRRDLCRPEAVAVLRAYRERGGPIYNG